MANENYSPEELKGMALTPYEEATVQTAFIAAEIFGVPISNLVCVDNGVFPNPDSIHGRAVASVAYDVAYSGKPPEVITSELAQAINECEELIPSIPPVLVSGLISVNQSLMQTTVSREPFAKRMEGKKAARGPKRYRV